jgi:hypothetical protein
MEEGISPVKPFTVNSLETKSKNTSVIICHKILIITLQLTTVANWQDFQ